MFYSLRGVLVHYDATSIAVECGGVAYYCQTTQSTLSQIATIGKEVHVYTHLSIRQDNVDLFAFADQAELSCFKLLTTVSGVGPKAGLSILSAMTPDRMALCVASGDYKSLTAAQGIGNKIAQRIVLELKDKVSSASVASGFSDGPSAALGMGGGSIGEAVSALVVLGYSQADAATVVSKMDPEMSVEDMIRTGLKALAGKL